MTRRVAVVTGGNRGLGWEMCKQLAEKGILVVLASRNREKGLMAAEEFQKQELPVRYHELDVSSAASIEALGDFVSRQFDRCDILINNAGIFPDVVNHDIGDPAGGLNAPLDNVRKAMDTNVYGPLLLCQKFIPIMKQNSYGRIVNVSSALGQLGEMGGKFIAYRMSKTALNVITRVLSDELKSERVNVLINSMCPGWCKTDMGGPYAERTAAQGADTAVWLATLPDDGPTGGFFRDRRPIPW